MQPPCERFVPGYGDANAHFHVIGDHPGIHGGAETGVPFTGCAAGRRLQRALHDADLLETTGDDPEVDKTYLSYLHTCVSEGEPTDDDYAAMEPFFDAELRAIAAHVLLPVGERAIRHVLETCTAHDTTDLDVDSLHATEVLGSGWLVVPIREPTAWDSDDASSLVAALDRLRATDYRRESDLGRFVAGNEPYLVR
ncbi:uracil-DNA glycosylase family 4 [Haloplanus aerogenes]|nr:uracil-DNA glycosylase family 4 [Haloplanus aerogenes]